MQPPLRAGVRPGAPALARRGVAQEVLLLQALPQGLAVLRRMGLEQLAAAAPAVVAGVMEMRRRNRLHLLWSRSSCLLHLPTISHSFKFRPTTSQNSTRKGLGSAPI